MIHHLTKWLLAALIGCVLVATACTSTRTVAKHVAANCRDPVSAPAETPYFEEGVWRYLLLQRKDLRQSNFPMHFSEEPLDLIANTLVNDLDLLISIHSTIGNVVISEFAADDSLFTSIEKLVEMAGGSWHLGAKTIFIDAANGVSNDPLIRRQYHQSRAVDSGTGRFSSIALEAWLASSVPGLGFVSCEWTPDGSLLVTTYELSHGRICCPLSSLGLRVQ